ncbi:hypothetical protein DL568_14645 [Escherichia coli]|nr:hypothetical protein [Escherichia coli]PJW23632.1 hypothetical protein CWM40_23780 [Escherichia coli]HCO9805831.1 hypothetical protein [Escherichia coli]
MIWQPEFTDKTLSRKPGAVHLGLSKTFRRLIVTLIRHYGVSLIHLDACAECLPGLPTFDW